MIINEGLTKDFLTKPYGLAETQSCAFFLNSAAASNTLVDGSVNSLKRSLYEACDQASDKSDFIIVYISNRTSDSKTDCTDSPTSLSRNFENSLVAPDITVL